MCFSFPHAKIISCHSKIDLPYFFSIEGKYEAGPSLGQCVVMYLSRTLKSSDDSIEMDILPRENSPSALMRIIAFLNCQIFNTFTALQDESAASRVLAVHILARGPLTVLAGAQSYGVI